LVDLEVSKKAKRRIKYKGKRVVKAKSKGGGF
jgi:hypothetical protein